MKKLISLTLALAAVLTLAACGNLQNANTSEPAGTDQVTEPEATAAPEQETAEEKTEAPGETGEQETEGATEEAPPVAISHTDVTLAFPGESFRLRESGVPGIYAVTITSDDPAIAAVDEEGVVTAMAPGTTNVRVHIECSAGVYDLTCIVRCRWTETEPQLPAEPELPAEPQLPTEPAGGVNLAAFYTDMTSRYEFGFLENLTGDLLENYYAGMGAIETRQCLVMGSMMTMNNGEFCLVEVADSADAEAVEAIFQSRVDYMVDGGAWYPEPTEIWTNNSRVVSFGPYVMMVVHPSCDDIVEAFEALCGVE